MSADVVTIGPEHAAPVLHHFGAEGGYQGSGFVHALLELLSRADLENRAKLYGAFPEYVLAFALAKDHRMGLRWLGQIVAGKREGHPVAVRHPLNTAYAVTALQWELNDAAPALARLTFPDDDRPSGAVDALGGVVSDADGGL